MPKKKNVPPTTGVLWRFVIDPVPASRPRVSRYGTYYLKTYASFIRAAKEIIPKTIKRWSPVGCALELWVIFWVPRPAKTTRDWPRGDWDNYSKAICDSMNKLVYADDDQVIDAHVAKRFVSPGDKPHITVYLRQTDPKSVPFADLQTPFTKE